LCTTSKTNTKKNKKPQNKQKSTKTSKVPFTHAAHRCTALLKTQKNVFTSAATHIVCVNEPQENNAIYFNLN